MGKLIYLALVANISFYETDLLWMKIFLYRLNGYLIITSQVLNIKQFEASALVGFISWLQIKSHVILNSAIKQH